MHFGRVVACVAWIALVGGCGGNDDAAQGDASEPTSTVEAAPTVPTVPLPTYPPSDGTAAYPQARLGGTLEIRGECAYLVLPGEETLLVWSHGTHLETRDGRPAVVDAEGVVRGFDGQEVSGFAGGQYPTELMSAVDPPPECPYENVSMVNPSGR